MTIPIAPMAKVRLQLERALVARSQAEAGFRALLLSDPRAALKALLGLDPIPSHTLRVIEEETGEIILVLPRRIEVDELPDELLDLASGGASGWRDEWGNTWKWDKTGHPYHTDVCGVEHHTEFSQ